MKLPKMKIHSMILFLLPLLLSLTATQPATQAQTATSGKAYQQMSSAERLIFVDEQARRVAREMSGNEYEFTAEFVGAIQQSVDWYVRRLGNGANNDTRVVFERGQLQAAALTAAFRARNVSPLIGVYIPWIESAYVNIQTPNPMGSIGMFQFVPKTGQHYGLSAEDLLDVPKSADAAARYISDSLKQFAGDPMKEALALLAYNRGGQQVARDLKALINDQNKQCSICALTAASSKLDVNFQNESVYYVPRFFAAAIIGENPASFGLQSQPLSSH